MIVMLPKKGKLLKTLIMANCEEVGGQGRERKGVEGPIPTDSLADCEPTNWVSF